MTQQEQTDIVAVLTTLAEVDGAPETMIYLAVGSEMERWNKLKYALVSSGLVVVNHNFVTITAKGKVLADKLNLAMAAA